MLKLLSLNMEGAIHFDVITPFIKNEQPDVLCLQEMPASYIHELISLGYHVTFRPMWINCALAPNDVVGIAVASKTAHDAETFYYYGQTSVVEPFDPHHKIATSSFGCVLAEITDATGLSYIIGTTHLPVTTDGKEDVDQTQAVNSLLKKLSRKPAHMLCGDLNIPRGYNTNYESFLQYYTDSIPDSYTSSLDATHHRCAHKPDLNAPIFDIFMVDYIFSQPPYHVSDVRLAFGISDHAAVIGYVSQSTSMI